MRWRHLVFLPFATVIGLAVITSASSFVSALERSVVVPVEPQRASIRLRRYETVCDGLSCEAHALSREAMGLEARGACAGSPLDLMDYAWGGTAGAGPACGGAHGWQESASSDETGPAYFVF